MEPSRHLTWKELACKDGTEYPKKWIGRAVLLGSAFETIRAACGGKPIRVLSGYRTPSHNRKIGGAKHSQHVEGRALDLKPPEGLSLLDFHEIILKLVPDTDIRGVGLYGSFVHIDIRPTERLVRWTGFGLKDTKP